MTKNEGEIITAETKILLATYPDIRIYKNINDIPAYPDIASVVIYTYGKDPFSNRKDPMQNEIQLFKALSDGTRLRILLLLLNNGELCVCDLMESLQIPQSTASRHLALLRSAGLVDGERRGTWMYYRLIEDETLGSAILAHLKQHCARLETAIEDHKRCLEFLGKKNGTACRQ